MDTQTTVTKETVVTEQPITEQVIVPRSELRRDILVTEHTGDTYEFTINKTNQVIWVLIAIINLLIALRFIFLLFGANRVGFVSALYNLTDIFVLPFRGVFEPATTGESYFDTAAILAIIMWTVIGFILTSIVRLLSTRDTTV